MKKSWFKPATPIDLTNGSPPKLVITKSPPSSSKISFKTSLKRNLSSDSLTSFCDNSFINNTTYDRSFCLDFASSNWIENFAPKTSKELAVHQKKINEIQDWFKKCEELKQYYPGPILLVSGPSGSAKTQTINLLANELGYQIQEWVNPVDVDLIKNVNLDYTYRENQNDRFSEFLFRGSRYDSLFNLNAKRLIIVEDFPNYFIHKPDSFIEILSRYTEYGKSPLIFIATETKSKRLNIVQNQFPDSTRILYKITHITFNPIAPTQMKKGLKRICCLMSRPGFVNYYTQPSQDMIDSIITASQGDIRSAVINLHFTSQKNAPKLRTGLNTSVISKGKTQTISKVKKLTSIGRDESITLMHGLGRVFNPKYQPDEVIPNLNRFTHCPEEITESFVSQPTSFVSFVHKNYLEHFSVIENVADASNVLCDCDQLLREYRDDLSSSQFGLNLAIRGIMVYNEKSVGGWKPIRGPHKLYLNAISTISEQEKMKTLIPVPNDEFALDYRTYVNIINHI